MQDFWLWFSTGFSHICDWQGYDHILFILAICVMFSVKEWKSLLLLVTAFTLGHSLTLALSVLKILNVPSTLVEILIPLTIIATCIHNILNRNQSIGRTRFNYLAALFFGCIHGLGFSYLLRSLLGKEENIALPLFSFNIGLEAGQLLIISVFLLISLTLPLLFNIKKDRLILAVSSAISCIAVIMISQRFTNLYN
ncbi:MAG: HupE/UreJ family protein [Bacteroidia bacterium]